MNDRIVDISNHPAYLQVRMGHLEFGATGIAKQRVPIRDLGAVILANPRATITQSALAQLAGAGVCVITTDAKRTPIGMMLPLAGHSTQTERFARQAELTKPTKKRLWQQVVKSKIRAQSRLLLALNGTDAGLTELAKRVRSGDTGNLEAQAARRYWSALFPDGGFIRSRDGGGANPALNYGYAVLGAMTARAIVGAGLHPSLGLAHHNRYDAFCLARDLMEPYRPVVDRVARCVVASKMECGDQRLDSDQKRDLLEALSARYTHAGESRTLFDWIAKTSTSFARVVMGGESRKLDIAEI